jgi:hypothetical protein
MQALAAEFSGYAGRFRCFFSRKEFKQDVWISVFKPPPSANVKPITNSSVSEKNPETTKTNSTTRPTNAKRNVERRTSNAAYRLNPVKSSPAFA